MQLLRTCASHATLLAVLSGLGLFQVAAAAEDAKNAPAAPAQVTPAMVDSVTTVDTLIKNENREALARSAQQAVAAGLATAPAPQSVKAAGPAAPQLFVLAIFGIEGNLRANLAFNGEIYENVRTGVRVGQCVIRSIEDRTVALGPAARRGSTAGCPTGKWTGVPLFPQALPAPAPGVAGGPQGLPSPAVPMPYSSVGQPSMSFQPPGLRSSQPMVQWVPGGPPTQGQSAAPLIPRQVEPDTDSRLQQPAAAN